MGNYYRSEIKIVKPKRKMLKQNEEIDNIEEKEN